MPASILIVDDEEMILDSLSAILRKEGYEVACAKNGEEGLEEVKKRTYDLVISDIRMPGMNGLEMVERIKGFIPDQKILVITGYGSLDTAVKAQHRGVCDYLIKPIDVPGLKQSIRRALKSTEEAPRPDVRQLDDKLKDLTQYFSLVSEFTANLNASLDVNEIISATLDRLRTIGETEFASLYLFPNLVHELYYLKNVQEQPALSSGTGISVTLAETGQMIVDPIAVSAQETSGPTANDPRHTLVRRAMARDNIQHALVMPLVVKDKTIGIIDVCSTREEAFTEIDTQLSRTIVNQASLALAKAFSYIEMEERSKEIGLLYNLSLRLNQSLKISDSIKAICEGAVDITGAGGSLLQTSLEPGSIKNFIFHKDLGFHKEIKRSSQDWLIPTQARKEAFYSNDPVMDPRVNSLALYSLGIKSLAYVPLIYEWEDLGGLTVFYKAEGKTFDERDLHLLHLFARHASEVLLNAQLFESIKRSREKIITEKSKMDIILGNMADGVVTMDMNCRITYANESVLRMFGRTEDQLLGKPCHEIFALERCTSGCPVRVSPDRATEEEFYEASIGGSEGRRMMVYVSLAPIRDGEGAVTGWVKVLRNIDKIKEIDSLKDSFFHALAHDLRTPLMSLMGFLELLGESGTLSDKQKHAIGVMETSAGEMNRIIDDLLDVYRSRNAGLPVRAQKVDMHGLIRSVMQEMSGIAETKRITLDGGSIGDSITVHADLDLMKRVLNNLLGNAIKNTPEGGSVRVSMGRAQGPRSNGGPARSGRRSMPEGEYLSVSVENTGARISDEDLKKIFDQFYQAGEGKDRKKGGTGLGLSIARDIVDAHGGAIWAENVQEGGARFTFAIPITPAPPRDNPDREVLSLEG